MFGNLGSSTVRSSGFLEGGILAVQEVRISEIFREIDFFTIENFSISRKIFCEIDYIQNFIYLFQEHQWKLVY